MNVPPHKIADGWLLKFLLGGNATFTVRSLKTGTRFTFRVQQPKPFSPHFVSVLTGSDNEHSYSYLGTIHNRLTYGHGRKSGIAPDDKRAIAAMWVCTKVLCNEPLQNVEVWHEGRCGRCGRKLTVPESIDSGFGPECIRHI